MPLLESPSAAVAEVEVVEVDRRCRRRRQRRSSDADADDGDTTFVAASLVRVPALGGAPSRRCTRETSADLIVGLKLRTKLI